jgi:HK97 family phage prohead protease
MFTRDFGFRIKSLGEDGTFDGLASPHGPPCDLDGDEIAPGAYKQAILQQPPSGYPLLWIHDQTQPLGVARVQDSPAGLGVNGKLFLQDPNAQKAYIHMQGGSVRGLSIGYLPPNGNKVEHRSDGTRLLKEVHLKELSVVPIPAAPRAQITSVKQLGDVRRVLKCISDGDVNDDVLSHLVAIDFELKRLLVARDPVAENAEILSELQGFAAALRKLAA